VYDFARAIIDLLADEQGMRDRARRLTEKTKAFDWQVQADKFLEYLRRRGFSVAQGRSGK
jgi:hypothetical protein